MAMAQCHESMISEVGSMNAPPSARECTRRMIAIDIHNVGWCLFRSKNAATRVRNDATSARHRR
jgi:hypothetical protein